MAAAISVRRRPSDRAPGERRWRSARPATGGGSPGAGGRVTSWSSRRPCSSMTRAMRTSLRRRISFCWRLSRRRWSALARSFSRAARRLASLVSGSWRGLTSPGAASMRSALLTRRKCRHPASAASTASQLAWSTGRAGHSIGRSSTTAWLGGVTWTTTSGWCSARTARRPGRSSMSTTISSAPSLSDASMRFSEFRSSASSSRAGLWRTASSANWRPMGPPAPMISTVAPSSSIGRPAASAPDAGWGLCSAIGGLTHRT